MNIRILPMTAELAASVAALETVCFSEPWSEESLQQMVGRQDAVFLCAFVDGAFAGYAGMLCVLDEGQICNVATAPSFRRLGVGRALMSELEAEARRRSLSVMMLEVRASGTAAQSLYLSAGFEKVGVRRGFYASPREDAFLYNRYLQ